MNTNDAATASGPNRISGASAPSAPAGSPLDFPLHGLTPFTGPDSPFGRSQFLRVMAVQIALVLTAGTSLIFTLGALPGVWLRQAVIEVSLLLAIVSALIAIQFALAHRRAAAKAGTTGELLDSFLSTSREWLWAVDSKGHFTFSSPASTDMFGYAPEELIGKHSSLVIAAEDQPAIRNAIREARAAGHDRWTGAIATGLHRDGSTVGLEVSGRTLPIGRRRARAIVGTIRILPHPSAHETASQRKTQVTRLMSEGRLMTAFQPIRSLATGGVVGAEALSRFATEDGSSPEYWFQEAAAVGLGTEMELAALTSTLSSVHHLPDHVYVALNVSPRTCVDPALIAFIDSMPLALDRVVIEMTELAPVDDYDELTAALEPLRARGIRIAIDDAGSGFASMRHVLQIRPDIIKLDRTLISGIDNDRYKEALGAAIVDFANRTGATIVAEGIETPAELESVTALGMTAGQGYLLGRPSVDPKEWGRFGSKAPTKSEDADDRGAAGGAVQT